jgi:large subunit ribosomal protein L1
MDNKTIKQALTEAKKTKKNFKQSVDLVINLKNLNIKKSDEQVEFFMQLHFDRGKKTKVCALVGPELAKNAEKVVDKVVLQSEFENYQKDKKLAKKLVKEYDFFIAQANIMPQVATAFGKVLGPKGKMPNPKAGCIVPPSANLEPLYKRLQKTLKISAKTTPVIHIMVGKEDMKDEDIIDNIKTIYDQLIHHLPGERNNISSIYLKLTMGKPIKLM